MDIKIDCIIWYIKNGATLFLKNAAIISQTKPTPPAVKYDAAESIFSIGYGELEVRNYILFSFISNIIF